MPWYNGDYPPSYKNQPVALRRKAVEIANKLLENDAEEGGCFYFRFDLLNFAGWLPGT